MTLTAVQSFFSGCVYLSERNPTTGRPERTLDVQAVDSFTLTPTEQEFTSRSKCDPNRAIVAVVNTNTEISIAMTMKNTAAENFALFFKGAQSTIASGSVTGETFVLGEDKIFHTEQTNISGVVINATAPSAAVVPGADITVDASGTIKIAQSNAITAGTVNYSYGQARRAAAYVGAQNRQYRLRFDGIDLAQNSQRVIVDVFNCKFWADGSVEFLAEDFVMMGLTGRVLPDPFRTDTQPGGRWVDIRRF